ncbi:EH domain-containing protein 2 [Lates japonicus]|uniref:EH domain-containing protein 2 n=1 Tax=Lates japonicus TaxID=270547 RepID=A0AAD3NG77_LATJO|nr:EH domain-containing protein 2 [Lates japonicus]
MLTDNKVYGPPRVSITGKTTFIRHLMEQDFPLRLCRSALICPPSAADRDHLLFDAHKLDISDEFSEGDPLPRTMRDKMRGGVEWNKADQIASAADEGLWS